MKDYLVSHWFPKICVLISIPIIHVQENPLSPTYGMIRLQKFYHLYDYSIFFWMCITLITSEFQCISYVYKMTCFSIFNCPFVSFSHFALVLFVISLLIWSCIPLKHHSYLQHWSFCNISSVCFNSEYVKSLLM